MSTFVVVNPTAGGGRAGRDAQRWLASVPGEVDIRRTVGPGHATALVRAARERGVERFISVGGDGTLHEVVNGALSAGTGTPRVGLLPLGTGNSFGRDVGIGSVDDAVQAFQREQVRTVDALRLVHAEGELWSINLVGLGFSALAGELTNRRFKRLGALGYVAAVLIEWSRLQSPRFRYRLDEGPWIEEPLIMLSMCNSRFTGGAMQMAPAAAIDDGELDIVALGPMSRPRFLSAFPKIFQGTHVDLPEVTASQARKVTFDLPEPVDVMIDGEVERLALTHLEVVPSALEVVCRT